MSWLNDRFEEWRPKSLRDFIGSQGASFFLVGLIVFIYFFIVHQDVAYFAIGMTIVGVIMVLIGGDPEEED